MKNNYLILNACVNCHHVRTIGSEWPESYHCQRWRKVIFRPKMTNRKLSNNEYLAKVAEADVSFRDTQVLPNGICDDYEKYVPKPETDEDPF